MLTLTLTLPLTLTKAGPEEDRELKEIGGIPQAWCARVRGRDPTRMDFTEP